MRRILKFIINSIIGILLLFIINEAGATWNFHIGINLFTALFVRNIRSTRGCIFSDFKIYYVDI